MARVTAAAEAPAHGLQVVDLPRTALPTLRLAMVAARDRPPKGRRAQRYRLNLKRTPKERELPRLESRS